MSDRKVYDMCWCVFLCVVAICVAVVKLHTAPLGPEYVTVNGKKMQCVAIQVTRTETAASCDWESIRAADK